MLFVEDISQLDRFRNGFWIKPGNHPKENHFVYGIKPCQCGSDQIQVIFSAAPVVGECVSFTA
jgi:hypothetical protein